jgi:hypothetical protein
VGEVEPGHLLVADLRVQAHHLRALQGADEPQRVADRRQQDVAARLVGLGLDREPDAVALLGHVLAEQVQALLVAVQRGPHVLGRVVLRALAAAPQHVGVRAQRRRQVDVAQHLAQGVAAYRPVVGREPAVLEDRVLEEVRGRHGDLQAGLLQRRAEPVDVGLALGVGRAERNQVVVVEGHAICAQLGQLMHRLDGVERRTRGVAERIACLPAHGPQTEGERDAHVTAPG